MKTDAIQADSLARVEVDGVLSLKIDGSRLVDLTLQMDEPPRFFEAILRGRKFTEAPDIASRISGLCPVAYQMSACHAIEDAFDMQIGGPIRDLRRLLYCGEWIQNHALHVHMLHAPDFLGYEDAIGLANEHPAEMQRGLQLRKTGNDIVSLVGGREVHPINVRVGGFYKIPARRDLDLLAEKLKWARDAAVETVRWVAAFPFPDFERDYEFVALRHPDEYPINEGRLVSNKGLDIAIREYDRHFEVAPDSNALPSIPKPHDGCFVGPQARYNLNFAKLSPLAQEAALDAGLGPVCRNPFQSIIVRGVEIVYACDEALQIIEEFEPPDIPSVDFEPRVSVGYGCTEGPRGILYHRYRLGERGAILDARIVPPTARNQKVIEGDLRQFVSANIGLPKDKLQWHCEQAIRNYGPCISFATHFLKLNIGCA